MSCLACYFLIGFGDVVGVTKVIVGASVTWGTDTVGTAVTGACPNKLND